MGFYGAIDISTVIEVGLLLTPPLPLTPFPPSPPQTMAHAVYVYDIQHVVVDNLQFMLGSSHHSSLDRFSVQNQAVAEFRRFASAKNVHITLVIHPRKVREMAPSPPPSFLPYLALPPLFPRRMTWQS